jgi:hypothetical protein
MVTLSFDDTTSGLPLAVEVAISPQWKIEETIITTERCLLDKKCLWNTNRNRCRTIERRRNFQFKRRLPAAEIDKPTLKTNGKKIRKDL